MSDDKREGIERYLSTYQRTETKQLVEVTDDNLMGLASTLGGTIDFEDGRPRVTLSRGQNTFRVGDLIDRTGRSPVTRYDWRPAETGDLINGGDLR